MIELEIKLSAEELKKKLNLKDGERGLPGPQGEPGKSVDKEELIKEILEMIDTSEIVEKVKKEIGGNDKANVYGPGKTRIIKVDLSDQLNGVKKTFDLPTHFGIVSVQSSSFPFGAFRDTIDYNEVGKTVVFTDQIDAAIALATGQSLIVKVIK